MIGLRIAAATAAITVTCGVALADAPNHVPRYRLEEVRPPTALVTRCLAGYGNTIQGAVNDFGVVGGNFSCTSQLDTSTGQNTSASGPFVWSSWFGALELHDDNPAFMTSINNRNEVFGADFGATGLLTGIKWSLAGGLETIFPNDPGCDVIKLDIAIAGNSRYAVGTGFRPSPDLPIPGLCLSQSWITRTPSGQILISLLSARPTDINAFNVGVGVWQENTAIRLNVVSNELRVLHSGDNLQRALATDINDGGEVSGYLSNSDPDPNPPPGTCSTVSAVPLRWDRDDHETVLQNLPGAVSARAWGAGHDGTTVGDSGPGEYCEPAGATHERAVLWRGDKPLDLNSATPSHHGVTLVSASSVNRWGQLTASGYRNSDPMVLCQVTAVDPQTGQQTTSWQPVCRHQRLYVLTP